MKYIIIASLLFTNLSFAQSDKDYTEQTIADLEVQLEFTQSELDELLFEKQNMDKLLENAEKSAKWGYAYLGTGLISTASTIYFSVKAFKTVKALGLGFKGLKNRQAIIFSLITAGSAGVAYVAFRIGYIRLSDLNQLQFEYDLFEVQLNDKKEEISKIQNRMKEARKQLEEEY